MTPSWGGRLPILHREHIHVTVPPELGLYVFPPSSYDVLVFVTPFHQQRKQHWSTDVPPRISPPPEEVRTNDNDCEAEGVKKA